MSDNRLWTITDLPHGGWLVMPKGRWSWFRVFYAPGVVVLTGDAGDIIISHHHALRGLANGLSWLATSDAEYLLGKSDKVRAFSADDTIATLMCHFREAVENEDEDWLRRIADRVFLPAGDAAAYRAHLETQAEESLSEIYYATFGEGGGSYTYGERDRELVRLLQRWARMMQILTPELPT